MSLFFFQSTAIRAHSSHHASVYYFNRYNFLHTETQSEWISTRIYYRTLHNTYTYVCALYYTTVIFYTAKTHT